MQKEELGGVAAKIAGPNGPNGYSMPYAIMFNHKTWSRGLLLLKDCLGLGWWVVSNCIVHCLINLLPSLCDFFPLFLIKLSISLQSSLSSTFFNSMFHSTEVEGGGEQAAVWFLAACWDKPQLYMKKQGF